MKRTFIIKTPEIAERAQAIIATLPLEPVHEVVIREARSIRTLEQNAKMWAMLTDISEQVNWYGEKLTEEEWKDVLTAGLLRQKVVPGIEGGFVVIGARTSKMSIKLMAQVIELAEYFGGLHEVRFKDQGRSA